MADCVHSWVETGGASGPDAVETFYRCKKCGVESTTEIPRTSSGSLSRAMLLELADDLEKVAARARAMAALLGAFCLLFFAGCAAWPLGAPPYTVCMEASVPRGDAEVWRVAEQRWNVELGVVVLLDSQRACDVRVRASNELDELACTLAADDHVRIFYVPELLEPCVALHELAHVLLGPGVHVPGTVLDEYGCDYPDVLAPVAQRVQQKWGL